MKQESAISEMRQVSPAERFPKRVFGRLALAMGLIGLLATLIAPGVLAVYGQEPTATPGKPPSGACCAFVVRSGVPFVWMRGAPSSNADAILSVTSVNLMTSVLGEKQQATEYWDGSQWWRNVIARGPNASYIDGWTEESLLEAAPLGTIAQRKADWSLNLAVQVKRQVPYIWLRSYPFSDATVMATIQTGEVLVVLGAPAADGRQWWWPVRHVQSNHAGWVEQNSLEAAPVIALTPTEVPYTPIPILGPESDETGLESVTREITAAYQQFENGFMIWRDSTIYVMLNDGRGTFYNDSADRPENPIADTPPEGKFKPVRGFGRVWGNIPLARDSLGWATAPEQGYIARINAPAQNDQFPPQLYFSISLPDGRLISVSRAGSITEGFTLQWVYR